MSSAGGRDTSLSARCLARLCSRTTMCVIDWIVSLIGPLLASLATFLILFVTYSYFTELLPVLLIEHGTAQAQMLTLFGVWLLVNLLWNYFCTMFVGPGHSPDIMGDDTKSLLVHDPEVTEGQSHRFCRKCNKVKPMRAHHCSICNKCVLKMDHHCPWVNNCVGHYNHKYFLGFLAYMCSGAGFVLFVSFETTLQALSGRNQSAVFLISTVMCFSAFVATGLFFSWNLYLVMTNQTTIEFYGNKFSSAGRRRGNPYDLGYRRNLEEVFGVHLTPWRFLFPNRVLPAGDGIIYTMRAAPLSQTGPWRTADASISL